MQFMIVLLFVLSVRLQTSSETVRHHFSQFGPVLEAIVVHDPVTNRSKQFAFVTFEYAESADHALRSRGMVIDGRQIEVRLRTSRLSA